MSDASGADGLTVISPRVPLGSHVATGCAPNSSAGSKPWSSMHSELKKTFIETS